MLLRARASTFRARASRGRDGLAHQLRTLSVSWRARRRSPCSSSGVRPRASTRSIRRSISGARRSRTARSSVARQRLDRARCAAALPRPRAAVLLLAASSARRRARAAGSASRAASARRSCGALGQVVVARSRSRARGRSGSARARLALVLVLRDDLEQPLEALEEAAGMSPPRLSSTSQPCAGASSPSAISTGVSAASGVVRHAVRHEADRRRRSTAAVDALRGRRPRGA